MHSVGLLVVLMKKLTTIEYATIAFASLILTCGIVWLVSPQEFAVVHAGIDGRGRSPRTAVTYLTESGSRMWGVLMMVFGAGLVGLILYFRKNESDDD